MPLSPPLLPLCFPHGGRCTCEDSAVLLSITTTKAGGCLRIAGRCDSHWRTDCAQQPNRQRLQLSGSHLTAPCTFWPPPVVKAVVKMMLLALICGVRRHDDCSKTVELGGCPSEPVRHTVVAGGNLANDGHRKRNKSPLAVTTRLTLRNQGSRLAPDQGRSFGPVQFLLDLTWHPGRPAHARAFCDSARGRYPTLPSNLPEPPLFHTTSTYTLT
ncbi:hypothetical protein T440DRAFT_243821 [Plenodomus tracheiphilus IPT5]|uniref:Uncharacterized protein n=1 Tax=Plenodomus tracheiphilus IPT5 TaxID=1408161 RepID=A0A6A7BHB2_9PLEO|nr:hypothetical protein T440DRAFT_243821 [Plenodomus tracheiphilus IPT5]